jgi:hypothetical protein
MPRQPLGGHQTDAWHILHNLVPNEDLGPDHFTRRLGKDRQKRRLVVQLAALGFDVDLGPRSPLFSQDAPGFSRGREGSLARSREAAE